MGEYKNAKTKILIKHNECKHEYRVIPYSILCGTRCPKCNESHGELTIRRFLDNKKLKYLPQYKLNDCKDKNPLPFDFVVFNKNKTIKCLIEYDGEQHFKSMEMFGGEKGFKKIQLHDKIKTNYCSLNNIVLIRIPYTVKNIEKFLDCELYKLNNKENTKFNL